MEPVWKEAKACYKQQEKEIRDHNKKIEDQDKREHTMDKQVAAAKKKADADAQKWETLWLREMAGLAKYVVEYTEKLQMKTVHCRQKSTRGQIAKAGETPRKRGARRGAGQGRGCTTAASSTESDGEFSTLDTVSTVPPTPIPQPQPWPWPRPIQKKGVSIAQHPAIENTLKQSSTSVHSHEQEPLQSPIFGYL